MGFGAKMLFKLPMALAAVALLGAAAMLLWNWVVPSLFIGAQPLDFWHAIGLLALCRILFGGFHGHHGWRHRHGWRRRHGWHGMSREERERFDKESEQ